MSTIQNANEQTGNAPSVSLSHSLILLLAAGAGLGVASLYYSQPMLGILATAFGASDRTASLIPTLTQLGYAAGILFLSPLGDRFDRRTIILVKSAVLVLALLLTASATNMGLMLCASVLVGLSATLAQDYVPAAAALAPEHGRGKVVGTVMTGLLLGILLSRVIGGAMAEWFGWRTVYALAAVAVACALLAAVRMLPHFPANAELSYPALLGSMRRLWGRHVAVRRATLAQATLSIAFSAFWSTLALMLQHTYHLGSSVAGAFGLAGAAGSIAAPLAGRLADHRGARMVAKVGIGIAALSFASMLALPLVPYSAQIGLLVLIAVCFDFGVQAALVAHQTMIYGVDHAARSRLNAILFTGMFLGMAAGSSLGGVVLARWGWTGISILATVASLVALLISMSKPRQTRRWIAAARLDLLELGRSR
ncbi:MAG: MFS transporter [Terracidiphilus sp.]|nr:MFS transporter [Terracidiphilus sp.]